MVVSEGRWGNEMGDILRHGKVRALDTWNRKESLGKISVNSKKREKTRDIEGDHNLPIGHSTSPKG